MAKVIWLTGVSGAGKSTIGQHISNYLNSMDVPVEYLDGNLVRDFFDNDLGFTDADREMAIKRSVFGSYLLAKHGITVVVASIAGSYVIRDFIRNKLGGYYIQIYVKASIECVVARDVRGLYKAYTEGRESHLPGITQSYQEPRNPDLVIETETESIEESQTKAEEFLKKALAL